jgi:hypothetical protein
VSQLTLAGRGSCWGVGPLLLGARWPVRSITLGRMVLDDLPGPGSR